MFASLWVERFSGIFSPGGVWHLPQSGFILVGFLNQSFWIRSLQNFGIKHKLLMLIKNPFTLSSALIKPKVRNIFYHAHSKNPRRIKNSQELIISNVTFSLKNLYKGERRETISVTVLESQFHDFLRLTVILIPPKQLSLKQTTHNVKVQDSYSWLKRGLKMEIAAQLLRYDLLPDLQIKLKTAISSDLFGSLLPSCGMTIVTSKW